MNDPIPIERSIDALQPQLAPEEVCISALLDLKELKGNSIGKAASVSEFYSAMTGEDAPEDLRTRIDTHVVEQVPQDPPHYSPQKSYVEGFEIAATIVVDFDARENGVGGMLNLDFVKTPEGLRLMQRQMIRQGDDVAMQYTREISEEELAALARDAMATKELIVEEEAELMKLGPLVEEESEDGSRRFHIGDILSVTTSRLTSPRGMEGIYDILGYMTEDSPFTHQLGRFAEECAPLLEQQLGEAIQPFAEVPETVKDRLSLYKWLHSITETMDGDPFLSVGKISKEDHADIDPMTELELDHGPEVMKKVIQIDPNLFERDEE